MKKAMVLMLASFLWGCGSDLPKEDQAKPGVEERSPGSGAIAPGPSATPITPGADVGARSEPPGSRSSPLKDPNNILSKRSVFYEYDSDAIKDEFRPVIQAHAKYLAENPSAKALIQGNADERGSREYNIALAQRRADALKRMMTLLGARESQIDSVSLGEEKPRCAEQSESCYQQNRRSDILHSGEF